MKEKGKFQAEETGGGQARRCRGAMGNKAGWLESECARQGRREERGRGLVQL